MYLDHFYSAYLKYGGMQKFSKEMLLENFQLTLPLSLIKNFGGFSQLTNFCVKEL